MKIKKGFTLRTIGGVYVITTSGLEQVDFNKIITLNTSAAYLWQQIGENDFDETMLIDALIAKYGIVENLAKQDVSELLEQWTEAGLIDK